MGRSLQEREDYVQGCFDQVTGGQGGGYEEGGTGPGQRLAQMAKMHSSEGFYALDDPLEAAVFSVLVELMKEVKRRNADL